MDEVNRKKLLDELGDALMNINSAECCFINAKDADCSDARKLTDIWHQLYLIRKRYKEGLDPTQSKGEPEKTG